MATYDVPVSTTWTKLETLVKAVDSSFTVSSSFEYEIQNVSVQSDIRVCELATAPAVTIEGGLVIRGNTVLYAVTTGYDLYVKSNMEDAFVCVTAKAV